MSGKMGEVRDGNTVNGAEHDDCNIAIANGVYIDD